jgi:N-acetyl-alpha-D-muramate 1-phosphate uridylyltransferase
MILAAGRGERMRPLTDVLPKPLLRAGGKALIEYHLEHLAQAGFLEIVINHSHLGEMIEAALGGGERYGVAIRYSRERNPLETAGGIAKVLPLLGSEAENPYDGRPFLVINADIYCELELSALLPVMRSMQENPGGNLAHLVLVNNPDHHPHGDFALEHGKLCVAGEKKLTFSGIGVYRPAFFRGVVPHSPAKLAPLLRQGIAAGKIGALHYEGVWMDVGTPARLRLLERRLTPTPGAGRAAG